MQKSLRHLRKQLVNYIKKHNAELVAGVLVFSFLYWAAYITELDRRIEITYLCAFRPASPECYTIPQPKE